MTQFGQSLHPSRSIVVSIVVVALVYIAVLGFMENRGFWIVDNANKFIQMRAIIDSGYQGYDIPVPGRDVDPEFEYNPLPGTFSHVRDGRLFSIFSPVFAVVSSIPYRVAGHAGLYVIPLLAGIAILAGIAGIGGLAGMSVYGRHLAVIICGLMTPVWFYSLTFWEHTIAAAFAVWALYSVLRYIGGGGTRHFVIGCVLGAAGVYFREVLALYCLVLVAGAVFHGPDRRGRTLGVGIAVVGLALLPLAVFQWWALGSPTGFHLGRHVASSAGIAGHIADRAQVLYNLLLAFVPQRGWSVLLALPFLVLFAWSPGLGRRRFSWAVPVVAAGGMVLSAVSLGGYIISESRGMWMLGSNGLFSTVPLLAVGFVRLHAPRDTLRRPSVLRLVWLTAVSYAGLYMLAAPVLGSTGIHWGNRFLLVLYPLMALGAARTIEQWWSLNRDGMKSMWMPVILVALLTVSGQAYGVRLLAAKKAFTWRANRELMNYSADALIATEWWAPQELCTHFSDTSMFVVSSPDHINPLLAALRRHGHQRFVFVTSQAPQGLPQGTRKIEDRALGMFDFRAVEWEIPPDTGTGDSR
jgi:hypothetical protein